jgi:RimJ/RimL family protein N-acetyltransferase
MYSTPGELRQLITTNLPLLREASEERAAWKPGPDDWSAKQVLGHLIDSAANNHQRFVRAQFTQDLVFPGYPQEEWVIAQHYQEAYWQELLDLWAAYNLHLARVMAQTPTEARLRPRLPHNLDQIAWQTVPRETPATLEYLMSDYNGHLRMHLGQIARLLDMTLAGTEISPPDFRLETPRLILRRQVPEDLDDLWALYSDPEVTRFIPDAPRTREEAQAELEWHMHGQPQDRRLGLWATVLKENGRFIGRCGLLPWTIEGRNEVEVAYALARGQWGKGLATEAARAILAYGFEQLGLPRLVSLIDPENSASQRVAEKTGMRLEQKLEGIDGDGIPTWIFAAKRD